MVEQKCLIYWPRKAHVQMELLIGGKNIWGESNRPQAFTEQ